MLIIYYHLSLILQSQAFISWVVWATFSFALLCTVLMRSVITARLVIISAGPSARLARGSTAAPLMSTAHQYFISAPLLIVWLHHIYQQSLNTDLPESPVTFKSYLWFPWFCAEQLFDPHIDTTRTGQEPADFLVGNWNTNRWRLKQFASFECPAWGLWEVIFWVCSALCDMR